MSAVLNCRDLPHSNLPRASENPTMSHSASDVTPNVDREALYKKVWTKPMTTIARQHGVSSSFLARVCARLNVPRPPRGYWAKLKVSRAPTKPPLPSPRAGDPLEWSRDGSPARLAQGTPDLMPEATSVTRHRRSPRSTTHNVLVDAHEHFDAARVLSTGYLRPRKRRLIDLFVSEDSLDRALDLANSFFLRIESAGHRVAFSPFGTFRRPSVDERIGGGRDRGGYESWSPDRPTVAYIGSVAIGLTFFELSEDIEVTYVNGSYVPTSELSEVAPLFCTAFRPEISGCTGGGYAAFRIESNRQSSGYSWTSRRHIPTGRLCLRATSPYVGVTWEKQWPEKKRGELKRQLRGIVTELEASAPTITTLREEAEQRAEIQRREWEVQQEKWRREAEERRRAQNVSESRAELFQIIESWGIAKRTEEFFADIERVIPNLLRGS